MFQIKKSYWLLSLPIMLITLLGYGQVAGSNDSIQNSIKSAAKDIILSAKTCALITIDKEGTPRVRMMDPFAPEDDFTVWFGTNPKSRKVGQIENNSKVTLFYQENNGSGYVSLHGIAQLVNELSEKENRWKEEWKAFYKNKTDDYLLIKVVPKWMEVVSYSHEIVSTESNWQPPVVIFDSN